MFRKAIGVTTMALMLGVFLTTASYAQRHGRCTGSCGWGHASDHYHHMYDPDNVEIIRGTVVGVAQFTLRQGMSPGVHLTVQTTDGGISVHLGPAWFLERQDQMIVEGDDIEIRGSRIRFGGAPAFLAAEVHKGDEVLRLRDEMGRPVWSAWHRRGHRP